MQHLYAYIFPSLGKPGTMNDLEAVVNFTVRRGMIRQVSVTACAPGDNLADCTTCQTNLTGAPNVLEVIERLFIESAICWRQPSIPGVDVNRTRRYDCDELMR